jgi:hypothetical protein
MRYYAIAEEGDAVITCPSTIEELINDNDCAGTELFLEAATRATGYQPVDTEFLESPDVGAVINFRRRYGMTPAMSREERHSSPGESSEHKCIRWLAERRLHSDFFYVLQLIHLVKTTASENSDFRLCHSNTP